MLFYFSVQWPINVDFENPSEIGIKGARNLSIEYKSKVDNCDIKIGKQNVLFLFPWHRCGAVAQACDYKRDGCGFDSHSVEWFIQYFHFNIFVSDHKTLNTQCLENSLECRSHSILTVGALLSTLLNLEYSLKLKDFFLYFPHIAE